MILQREEREARSFENVSEVVKNHETLDFRATFHGASDFDLIQLTLQIRDSEISLKSSLKTTSTVIT